MKKYTKDIISNLYDTSESSDGSHLLEAKYKDVAVYDFDEIKKQFCNEYRGRQELHSCDAYYEGHHPKVNHTLVEYKNTTSNRLKEYFSEFDGKAVDSHMLLLETFWRNKKAKDIADKVKMMIVYKDGMCYGEAVTNFARNLNTVQPIRGSKDRSSQRCVYQTKEEFELDQSKFKEKFEGDFYKEVLFMNKQDFENDYINTGYFENLQENSNVLVD